MVKPSLYFPKREITSRLAKRCWEFSHKNFFVPNGQSSQSVDRHPQQYSGSERASSLSGVHYTTKYRRPTLLGWAFSFVLSPVFAGLTAVCVCQTPSTPRRYSSGFLVLRLSFSRIFFKHSLSGTRKTPLFPTSYTCAKKEGFAYGVLGRCF